MTTFAETPQVHDAFAPWAPVYDDEPNPVVHLEDRYLRRMLPDLAGRHVVDVGCGTGRRLRHLASTEAASFHGLDPSAAMLHIARSKLPPEVQLTQAALPSLPIASEAVDCVFASLVLGYVDDLEAAIGELSRVVRPGGDLFLSDLHPGTAMRLGWTRGTSAATVEATFWPLAEVEQRVQAHGFTFVARILPAFGDPELPLFIASGKQKAWRQAAGHPAVYLLHLRKQKVSSPSVTTTLAGGCALGPHEVVPASVSFTANHIDAILCEAVATRSQIDLSEYLLLPGLTNAHDHLEFALFPRLGKGPYPDATAWARDIHACERDTIALHLKVPEPVRLWWGALRNVLCGVTTVCHHNPLHATLRDPALPVHVLRQYGWAHSLAFAPYPADGLRTNAPDDPFFVHACEGVGPATAQEVQQLDRLGALGKRTVLIHGLALNDDDVTLLNERGAALAICPLSNAFLFGQNHSRSVLLAVDRLLLGSDSPLTSAGDLLDELRFLSTWEMEPELLYGMVTDGAAPILRLTAGEGTLRVGTRADLMAVRTRPGSPADILSRLSWHDVELVISDGEVVLASATVYDRLPCSTQQTLQPLRIDEEVRWLRAPVSTLLEAAEAVLGTGNVHLNGRRLTRVERDHAR